MERYARINTMQQGIYKLKPWLIKVKTLPNELLTSWLVRAALTQGCDPLLLTGEIWGKWRALTVDADRMYTDIKLLPLVHVSGISLDVFKLASLYPIAAKIYGRAPPEKAIWPWILALGARNTKRSGGLQYCPQCLKEDAKPYFRQQWRIAWHTTCERHQSSLLDRCHICNAPVEPQRLVAEDSYLKICATCKSDLSNAIPIPMVLNAYAFQLIADLVIYHSHGKFQGGNIKVSEWFKLVDFFISLLRRANRGRSILLQDFLKHLITNFLYNLPIISETGVELLRTHERQSLFYGLHQLLMSSKQQFKIAAIKSRITRQAFCSQNETLPSILLAFYETLPDNPKKRNKNIKRIKNTPRPRHEVMRMMAKLERKLTMAQR